MATFALLTDIRLTLNRKIFIQINARFLYEFLAKADMLQSETDERAKNIFVFLFSFL